MSRASNRKVLTATFAAVSFGVLACPGQSESPVFPVTSREEKTPAQVGVVLAKFDAPKAKLGGEHPERSGGCVIKDGIDFRVIMELNNAIPSQDIVREMGYLNLN